MTHTRITPAPAHKNILALKAIMFSDTINGLKTLHFSGTKRKKSAGHVGLPSLIVKIYQV